MIIDSTWESVALSVISQLASVIVKLNAIAKICKYRMFHEGHHFISMAMDVHDAPEHDMDHFIKECVRLFHDRNQEVIYLCLFTFNFSSIMLVLLFNVF